jgi:transposase
MKPFSRDLRERIVAVYEETELSYPQVATRFQVSESSVRRFVKQWRDTGMVEPKPAANGRYPAIDDVGVTVLAEFIKTQSDASQDELRAQLAVHTGTFVSQPTICRTLQRARITRKKRRNAPQNRNGKTSTRLAKPLRKS